MLEKALGSTLANKASKLYGHYDYFGYIIPAFWLVFCLLFSSIMIFDLTGSESVMRCMKSVKAFYRSLNAGGILLVGVGIFAILYNILYLIGHIISSFSAIIVDRGLVRKLLGYPFYIYGAVIEYYNTHINDYTDSSYLGRCIMRSNRYKCHLCYIYASNTLAHIILLLGLINFNTYSGIIGNSASRIALAILSLSSTVLVFGYPWFVLRNNTTIVSINAFDVKNSISIARRKRYVVIHCSFVLAIALLIFYFVYSDNFIYAFILLAVVPVFIVMLERATRHNSRKMSSLVRRVLLHYSHSLPCITYFIAREVNYYRCPSRKVLLSDHTRKFTSENSSDEYWLINIASDITHNESHSSISHFRSMYSMNRNMSTATAFILAEFGGCVLFTPYNTQDSYLFSHSFLGLQALCFMHGICICIHHTIVNIW